MLAVDIPALLHIAGYLTGATLYAMLLAMVLSTQSSESRPAIVTAFLGLTWNVGELSMHIASTLEHPLLASWLAAASYGALGLLAAVVVHSVSEGSVDDNRLTRCLRRLVLALAYGSAGLATVVHGWTAVVGAPLPSTLGLTINTAGLLGLSVPLALVTRGQAMQRRALWMVALAAFGVSALHVAQFHGTNEPWTMELLGHHASIPLAFALLYEDYRFALADLFLKHALTLLMVVAVVVGSYALVVLPLGVDGGALPPSAVARAAGVVVHHFVGVPVDPTRGRRVRRSCRTQARKLCCAAGSPGRRCPGRRFGRWGADHYLPRARFRAKRPPSHLAQ